MIGKSQLGIALAILVLATPALAGPLILGGDDLNCHGSRDGGGNNIEGWLYIEKALGDIEAQVTRGGPFTTDIAMLGTPQEVGCPATCPGGADSAAGSAAANAGLTIAYFDGAVAMQDFFDDLAMGTVNPKIIYLPGTDCSPDLDSTEGDVLSNNAGALQAFVSSGGGLLSHGCGGVSGTDCETAYGWLTTLIPGLNPFNDCNATGAMLTPAGQAALPGVNNSDIDSNAGPCHNTFSGSLGTLQALALDGDQRNFILGGLVSSIRESIPAPVTGALGIALVAGALAVIGGRRLRKS